MLLPVDTCDIKGGCILPSVLLQRTSNTLIEQRSTVQPSENHFPGLGGPNLVLYPYVVTTEESALAEI